MGLSKLSDISAALSVILEQDLEPQYNRLATTASLIKTKPGRGVGINWDVTFSAATAGSRAEGADFVSGDYNVDNKKKASLGWGHYGGAFWLTETQVDAAASSINSPEELMDILGDTMVDKARKLVSSINADVISGTGTDGSSNPNIVGLLGGVIAASGSYAGLARATYTEWQSTVDGNSGTPRALTTTLMDKMDKAIFDASGMKYDLLLCDSRTFNSYRALFQSSPVYQINAQTSGSAPVLSIGSDTLFYNGVRIVRDKDIAAGNMLFLNTDCLEIQFLPSVGQTFSDGVPVREAMGLGSNGHDSTPVGVPFKITPLAKTGDSYKFALTTRVQLRCKRPNALGLITDLS